jgi:tagatose 6-phosphate kinase
MVFKKLQVDAVNRAVQTLDGIAGKAINVAKVLQTLGEKPLATGFLGGDRGEFIRKRLKARGIPEEFINTDSPTRECITVIDEAAGTHTELVEESSPINSGKYQELKKLIGESIGNCHAMVMSGTLTPGAPQDFYFQCVQIANHAGILSVVDAQGIPLLESLKAGPSLVKPNRKELAVAIGRALGDESALVIAMRELAERGAKHVVITAGREPTLAFDGRKFYKIFGPEINAVNPIGSGDAFTAALISRLLRSEDLAEACAWASAAGAANALSLMPGELEIEESQRLRKQVRTELL